MPQRNGGGHASRPRRSAVRQSRPTSADRDAGAPLLRRPANASVPRRYSFLPAHQSCTDPDQCRRRGGAPSTLMNRTVGDPHLPAVVDGAAVLRDPAALFLLLRGGGWSLSPCCCCTPSTANAA